MLSDSAGSVTGITAGHKKPAPLIHKKFLLEQEENKGEGIIQDHLENGH